MAEHLVECREVSKTFRVRKGEDVTAVDDVSFALERGSSLAIVGESGSGKTTLARILLGQTPATSGRVYIDGKDRSAPAKSANERKARARELQMVFQDPYSSLDRRQTFAGCVDEVLRLHFSLTKQERAARIGELADQVGLVGRQRHAVPRTLSGGQRQRIAIARALAAEPKVLLLDEAVASLDVSIQAQILNLLSDIRRETGVSYIFISHDLAVVRHITQQALVMRDGSVVERGPTEKLLRSPEHPYTQLLLDSIPGPSWRPSRRTVASVG